MSFISGVLYLWLSDSFARPHVSIKFYPLPSEQIPACEPPNSPPQISPSNNRNWPLLPFSIPVCSVSSPDFITWQICTDPSLPPTSPPSPSHSTQREAPGLPKSILASLYNLKEKKKKRKGKERKAKGEGFLNLPIQRNWHSPKPSAQDRPHRSSPNLIKRQDRTYNLIPDLRIDAVNIEQRQNAEERHVTCAKDVVQKARR